MYKKTHLDANCMEIGFLLLKILQFYVFKMAAGGGCHFDININIKNYKSNFIFLNQAFTYATDICDLYLLCKLEQVPKGARIPPAGAIS